MHMMKVVFSAPPYDLKKEQEVLFMRNLIEVLRARMKISNTNKMLIRLRVSGVNGSAIENENGVTKLHAMNIVRTKDISASERGYLM